MKADLDSIVIATDSEKVRDVAEGFGADVVMSSPEHATGTDRVAEVARGFNCDIVVSIQCDLPFLEGSIIDSATQPLSCDKAEVMATTMLPLESDELDDPTVVKVVVDNQGYALSFFREPQSDFERKSARKHIGIYAFRSGFLQQFTKWPPTASEKKKSLEQLRALNNGVKIACTEAMFCDSQLAGIGIDTPEDIAVAEVLLKNRGIRWNNCP